MEREIEVRCSDVLSSRLRKPFYSVISHMVILYVSGFEEVEEMEEMKEVEVEEEV